MSARPPLQFDDLSALKNELHEIACESGKDAWLALKGSLSPEQLDLYYAHARILERHEYALGARDVLKGSLHRLMEMEHDLKKDETVRLLNREVSNLRAALREAEGKNRPARPPAIVQAAAVQPAPADWDYKPVPTQKPNRSEVVTDVPEQVRRVADRVEHYIRRHPRGVAKKPDVSSAFPSDRPYLAAAYRHLHASRRVRVNGWSLEAL